MAIYALLLGTKCLPSWHLIPPLNLLYLRTLLGNSLEHQIFPPCWIFTFSIQIHGIISSIQKVLTLSPLQLPLFFLSSSTNENPQELCMLLPIPLLPVKPILISMCFNIPPKTVKKKTSDLTLLYPGVISQTPF